MQSLTKNIQMREIIYNIKNKLGNENSLQCIKKAKLFQSVAEGICQLLCCMVECACAFDKKRFNFPPQSKTSEVARVALQRWSTIDLIKSFFHHRNDARQL